MNLEDVAAAQQISNPHGRAGGAGEPNLPLVTVALAVRNEAVVLGRCLAALSAQDYPLSRIELIVADGGSIDATPDKLCAFAAASPFHVTVVANSRRSAAAGFNECLRVAAGDPVIILGARAIMSPTFVSCSVEALRVSGAAAAGGVVIAEASGAIGAAIGLALRSPFGAGGARYRLGGQAGDVDTVNYGCYRRSVLVDAGGFDESMNNVEDDELNYRLRDLGMRLFFSPCIQAVYQLRTGFPSLARQFARYGYPKVRVLQRHPRQMQPRQFAPAVFVCALAVGVVGYRFWNIARWLVWVVAAAYALANAAATISLCRRHGARHAPLLPAIFAVMHLAYGTASVAGAARFAIWPAAIRVLRTFNSMLPEPARGRDE